MFIAHAPMGYIMATSLLMRHEKLPATSSMILLFGVLGSIAPDFDMIYFYLIDNRQTHHHKYMTHWPIIWVSLLVVSTTWLYLSHKSKSPWLAFIFSLGGFTHIILDSFVGDIWWFAPFVNEPYAMFTVPALFSPWWLNFVFHWSFAVELIICIWAMFIYRNRVNTLHSGTFGKSL
ncbi:MAG: metal-dependent hydrolase [Pseudomonas sp.]|nr:metal-dependent hydrolase [Pseudomonas sp.]